MAPTVAFHAHVTATRDEEAGVWFVSDSNVTGLATEADTLDELRLRLQEIIPALLEANNVMASDAPAVPIELLSKFTSEQAHC